MGPGFKKWARLEVDRCQQVSEDVVRCVADGLRIGRYPGLLLEGSRLQWNEDDGKMFVEVRELFFVLFFCNSDVDPGPYVFGPPGQCCGSGSGSGRIRNFLKDPDPE